MRGMGSHKVNYYPPPHLSHSVRLQYNDLLALSSKISLWEPDPVIPGAERDSGHLLPLSQESQSQSVETGNTQTGVCRQTSPPHQQDEVSREQ